MPTKNASRKASGTSRRKSAAASSSSSGGGNAASKHLASALQLLADRVVFVSESDKRAFEDHLILATGGENKDQVAGAKERHEEREAARKEANPA